MGVHVSSGSLQLFILGIQVIAIYLIFSPLSHKIVPLMWLCKHVYATHSIRLGMTLGMGSV